jgi:hypothetical protein
MPGTVVKTRESKKRPGWISTVSSQDSGVGSKSTRSARAGAAEARRKQGEGSKSHDKGDEMMIDPGYRMVTGETRGGFCSDKARQSMVERMIGGFLWTAVREGAG